MSILYRVVVDEVSGEVDRIYTAHTFTSLPVAVFNSISDLPDEVLKKYLVLRMAKPRDIIDGVGTVSMEWVSYDSGDKRTKVTYMMEV